jgi:hypothetical protein
MAEYCYAECHYAECHYAECHYAECHYAEYRNAIIYDIFTVQATVVTIVIYNCKHI